MQIDVISDTVCPWCFIAKRRLMRAMEQRPLIGFDVKWRPYRLDPNVPKAGVARNTYMRAKFGNNQARLAQMDALLAEEGAKEDIAFDFAAISRRPDTLDSHRLIRWSQAQGIQDEVVERLFIAYFENGEDIGDIRVLADIADICGMDGIEVARLLESDTDVALVEREDRLAHEMGVTGVPAMIFSGKLAVSGAREPELLLSVIDKVGDMQTPQDHAPQQDEESQTKEN